MFRFGLSGYKAKKNRRLCGLFVKGLRDVGYVFFWNSRFVKFIDNNFYLPARFIQHLSIFFQNFQYKIQYTRKQSQPQNPVILHFYSHKIKRIPDVMKDKQQ